MKLVDLTKTNKFIKKAKIVHCNLDYDYSDVIYVNARTDVTIICNIHLRGEGEPTRFNIKPNVFLNGGTGCWECKNLGRHLKFIKKAKKVHGNRYNYTKTQYRNSFDKVLIHCSKHGDFEQSPKNHLSGQGCNFCSNTSKLSTKEFIKRAKKLHGNLYDYSRVKYVNSNSKVIIICKVHGEYQQLARNHLSERGCPQCKGNHFDDFVAKAIEERGFRCVKQLRSGKKIIDVAVLHPNIDDKYIMYIECVGMSYHSEFIESNRRNFNDEKTYPKTRYINSVDWLFKPFETIVPIIAELEAQAVGLTFIGAGKNHNYRTYRFDQCGHEQEIRRSNVRKNTFICKQCSSVKT